MGSEHTISDSDRAKLFDYVDGRLDDDAMIELELRLENDGGLRAAFDDIADIEEAHRLAGAHVAAPARSIWRYRRALSAAAAVVVIGLSAWFWISLARADRGDFEVAILPSGVDVESHARILGLDPDLVPARLRGGTEPGADGGDLARFADAVRNAEAARAERALSSDRGQIMASYYVVPIRATAACSAVVLAATPDGRVRREFPVPGSSPGLERRFEPGVIHWLPQETVERAPNAAPDRDLVRRGFLVPRGCEHLRVLVALRAEPTSASFVAALDGFVAELGVATSPSVEGDAAARATRWLEERGFSVRAFDVRER